MMDPYLDLKCRQIKMTTVDFSDYLLSNTTFHGNLITKMELFLGNPTRRIKPIKLIHVEFWIVIL